MTDTFTKEKRRAIMQAVRRKRTWPEDVLAARFRKHGLRFRRNVADLPGKPDIFFSDARVAVFVHGCFWHGHTRCEKGRKRPKTNTTYWKAKIQRNQRRDRRAARQLRALGISVFTVWECELSATGLPKRLLTRLYSSNTKAIYNASHSECQTQVQGRPTYC
ncbi:MAG: DNA mismatch endonuclease Vsr [Pirellulales bacterium]|nr:DNA mismatch endonuclease Vsr [Pirellulales bacterium]